MVWFLPPLSANSIGGHWQLIEKRTNSSDWTAALDLVRDAIAEFPNEADFRVTEAWVLRNLKRNREATNRARNALAQFKNSVKLKEQLAHSLCALFDELYAAAGYKKENVPAEAYEIATEAYTLYPMAWSTTVFATSLRLQGRQSEAIQLLEKAVRKYPKEQFVRENLAFAYFDAANLELNSTKNYARAITLAESGLRYKPGFDWGVRVIAWANLRLAKYPTALAAFSNLLAANPQDTSLRDTLGYLYYEYTRSLAKKKDTRKLISLQTEIRTFADAPAERARHFVGALRNIADATEDFASLADFLKTLAARYRDEPYFHAMAGAVLNQVKLKLEREKRPEAENIDAESLSYLRRAMEIYERQYPNRPRLSGLALPVRGRFVVAAEFDGGGTHSGFEKYSYDFMHVDTSNATLKPGTKGNRNEHYHTFGEAVYAVLDGEVVNVTDDYTDHTETGYVRFGAGNSIQIRHSNGTMSHYAHIRRGSAIVKKGMQVTRGQRIAAVGNTGLSHAPHLHFCIVSDDWVTLYHSFTAVPVMRNGQELPGAEVFQVGDIVNAE